ncbi:MAG: B-box zinc finger protein [Thermodesulfobacteriota bacterium]
MAQCPEHPDQEATYQCESCGKPFCELCREELGYDILVCPECELLAADWLDII